MRIDESPFKRILGLLTQELLMLDRLSSKVTEMLRQFGVFKEENEKLRNDLMILKTEGEMKDQEIARLIQENSSKDLEIEAIVSQIESMLS